MRHYRLTNQERGALGFTDCFALDHKDLTDADTSQALALETLPDNKAILYKDAMVVVTEAFSGGGNSALVAKVGHTELNNDNTADDNYFVVDSSLFTKDRMFASAASGVAAGITGYTPLNVTFTSTGGTLAGLTTGEVLIYFKIIRDADVYGGQG